MIHQQDIKLEVREDYRECHVFQGTQTQGAFDNDLAPVQ